MGTIQIKRGLAANLPTSAGNGELLFTTDTKKFYVGNGTGNALTEFKNAAELTSLFSGKTDVGHTHTSAGITDFNTATDARITIQKGVANGIATLDTSGKIPTTQIPSTFKEASVVTDIVARNALTAFSGLHALVLNATGDVTVQSGGAEYVYDGTNWRKISELNEIDAIIDWSIIQNKPNFVQTFRDLTDTPNGYTGMGGKLLAVKSDLSGLEFVEQFSGNIDGGTF